MNTRIRETLPVRVPREQFAELRKSPDYFEDRHGRYMVVTENGERYIARLRVSGEKETESTGPPPNVVQDDDGDVAVPLDGEYIEPSLSQLVAGCELLLSWAEAKAYLDSKGLLNWRRWPSAPPSVNAGSGSALMYSRDDLDWWAEKWRNAFCDPDDMIFDEHGEPLSYL